MSDEKRQVVSGEQEWALDPADALNGLGKARRDAVRGGPLWLWRALAYTLVGLVGLVTVAGLLSSWLLPAWVAEWTTPLRLLLWPPTAFALALWWGRRCRRETVDRWADSLATALPERVAFVASANAEWGVMVTGRGEHPAGVVNKAARQAGLLAGGLPGSTVVMAAIVPPEGGESSSGESSPGSPSAYL